MNKDLPQSTTVAVIVVVVVLVVGFGWFYISHNSDNVAAVAGQHGAMSSGPAANAHRAGKPNE